VWKNAEYAIVARHAVEFRLENSFWVAQRFSAAQAAMPDGFSR
jgi:hypothetical protein